MKIGFAVGGNFRGRPSRIYDSLKKAGFQPEFILFCFPQHLPISRLPRFKLLQDVVKFVYCLMPLTGLRILFHSWFPHITTRTYFVKGINSDNALRILVSESPDVVIVLSCGIVRKRLCDRFPNVLLNAHAGKLPEFRGMNNVEWAYLEKAPLIGTIHFMASRIDLGDIVYEEELHKEEKPNSLEEIRERAFDQVFDLFPKALKAMQENTFKPIKQAETRTTRYVMHPFFKHMLEKKLSI